LSNLEFNSNVDNQQKGGEQIPALPLLKVFFGCLFLGLVWVLELQTVVSFPFG